MYTNINILYKLFLKSKSVFIDSRYVIKGSLFFALRGNRFDGNDFIEEVLSKDAHAIITDNIYLTFSSQEKIFYVKNAVYALQQLASYHRTHFHIPVIAIVGSNGKTTTKELVATAISRKYKTLFTEGNLNNHIGLPLTLLKLCKTHEIAVIEIGANHPGEIKTLCNIVQPNYGYITNFGSAHLEGFKSKEGVIRAKSELYDYLKKHEKIAFVCADDPLQMQRSEGLSRCFFSKTKSIGVKIEFLKNTDRGVSLIFNQMLIQSNIYGIHNFTNLSAAIAIADYFKVPIEEIKISLESYYPYNNRFEFLKKGSSHIFLDAYNANPSSMEAAIAHFECLRGNKIAILGDMLELGIYSYWEHLKVIKRLQNTDIVQFFLVGPAFSMAGINQDRIRCFDNSHALEDFFKKNPVYADYFLIKGSRKWALEKLVYLL